MKLVEAHSHVATRVAAGLAHRPGTATAFAATQAAWRFFHNERVPLPALAEPLRQAGRQALAASSASWALLVHDWCKLNYAAHTAKRDQVQLTHKHDVGYELTTALLVRAEDGAALAPLELHLRTADGVFSTREPAPRRRPHLEQVLPTMRAAARWGLSKPLVHVIDREADSVGHLRRWAGAGQFFLVRADDRRVQWGDRRCLLSTVVTELARTQAFRAVREVEFQGRAAQQWVAETAVTLYRPAKHRRGSTQREVPGPPLGLRLVVARVQNAAGRVLAEWLLLSNVPAAGADAAQLALWYYWRWRIESFFKLLKSAGHELEHWQQESGRAIARRLLVAAMACVVVWHLEQTHTPETEELKAVLVRLSGRQMKRARPYTAPALLAGLHVLLAMLALLNHYHLHDLRRLVATALPLFDTG